MKGSETRAERGAERGAEVPRAAHLPHISEANGSCAVIVTVLSSLSH